MFLASRLTCDPKILKVKVILVLSLINIVSKCRRARHPESDGLVLFFWLITCVQAGASCVPWTNFFVMKLYMSVCLLWLFKKGRSNSLKTFAQMVTMCPPRLGIHYRERIKDSCDQLRVLLPYIRGRKTDMASILEMCVDYLQVVNAFMPQVLQDQVCRNYIIFFFCPQFEKILGHIVSGSSFCLSVILSHFELNFKAQFRLSNIQ